MALTLDELQAVTEECILSTPSDIHFKSNVLLYKLLSKGKTLNGGKRIQQVLEYAAANGGSYVAQTKLPTDKKEIYNAAFFRWSHYFSQLTIDLDDQTQNNGDKAIVDLIRGKVGNAQKTIRNIMGSAVYSSATTVNDLLGLGDLFQSADTSIPYGEIQEADMSDWSASVLDGTTPDIAISYKTLQQIRQLASIDDNEDGKPDLYITTEVNKDGFERTLQAQQRFAEKELVAAGFQNVLFGGAPVVADNKCGANVVYGLNTRFLDVKSHSKFNFTKPLWASPVDQPDTAVAYIRWAGQLVCSNRKAHCYAHDIDDAA